MQYFGGKMLKLVNICKKYEVEKQNTVALNDISIDFRRSEFVAILGPSGCGKTTLLNVIGGLDKYTSGELFVQGRSTKLFNDRDWDSYRNHKVGFIFQSYNLIMHQKVKSNVEMALIIRGVEREKRKEMVAEALSKVGLLQHANKRPNQLSGGQMQRVAIARALITDPEIILADEPTGALDTESSVQVMELLKEASKDKLIIMVTHNPELAEKYATRIIRVSDGTIVDDNNPPSEEEIIPIQEYHRETPKERQEKNRLLLKRWFGKLKTPKHKRPKEERTSMSHKSAYKLSYNNLMTKKGRTIITTIAGSIGIIGMSLVLALSAGFKAYLVKTEENALSQYPISITRESNDTGSIMDILMSKEPTKGAIANENTVYVEKVLGNVISNLFSVKNPNDLKSLKTYLDSNFNGKTGFVKYDYGTKINIFSNYLNADGKPAKNDPNNKYTKINPFTDQIPSSMQSLMSSDSLSGIAGGLNAWDELVNDQEMLDRQYDLVGAGSRWPTSMNEVVFVVDKNNQIPDYMLFALGLKSANEIGDALDSEGDFSKTQYDINELIGIQYKLLRTCDMFVEDGDGNWKDYSQINEHKADSPEVDALLRDESRGVTLTVVGVVRPKEEIESGAIGGVAGYLKSLTDWIVKTSNESKLVQQQWNNIQANKTVGENGEVTYAAKDLVKHQDITTEEGARQALLYIGYADYEVPEAINIYANSFEDKQTIIAMLDNYNDNAKEAQKIKYTDTLALLMSSITQILNGATIILAGFSGISLIVSSLMIAIITYTSVIERKKEIGILRSLGARKKDIATVFNSETTLIGLFSGTFGVLLTYLMTLPVNAVLENLVGISNIMTVVWWQALCMIGLSILLSVIAGIIPSQIAAHKNPVEALRSGD